MRLALIASGFADYSLELAGALARHAEVVVWADAAALARERGGAPGPDGVEVRRFEQSSPRRRWGAAACVGAAVPRFRPHAVLAHEHAHPHLTALLRLAAASAPVALIVHDVEPHPGRDALFAARRRREIAAQRALARLLVCHGEAAAAALARDAGRPALAIRHGPILRPPTSPAPPPGEGRVVMFGRMEAYKGLDVLLAAAERLRDRGRLPRLEVRGAGPELQRLQARFQALPGCDVAEGPASREALGAALARSDLVVAPYRHASASGVAAAAMANGRGLVASDVAGLADMARAGVNAVLAPPGDPDALAGALLAALPHAHRLGQGARALGDGPFGWAETADRLLAALPPRARRAA